MFFHFLGINHCFQATTSRAYRRGQTNDAGTTTIEDLTNGWQTPASPRYSPYQRPETPIVTKVSQAVQTESFPAADQVPARVQPAHPSNFVWVNTSTAWPNGNRPVYIYDHVSCNWIKCQFFHSPVSPF